MFRLDRIEDLADVVVGGDFLDLKERLRIAAAPTAFHVPLRFQEGRALSEENRKGAQRDVGHAVAGVVAGSRIRQGGRAVA